MFQFTKFSSHWTHRQCVHPQNWVAIHAEKKPEKKKKINSNFHHRKPYEPQQRRKWKKNPFPLTSIVDRKKKITKQKQRQRESERACVCKLKLDYQKPLSLFTRFLWKRKKKKSIFFCRIINISFWKVHTWSIADKVLFCVALVLLLLLEQQQQQEHQLGPAKPEQAMAQKRAWIYNGNLLKKMKRKLFEHLFFLLCAAIKPAEWHWKQVKKLLATKIYYYRVECRKFEFKFLSLKFKFIKNHFKSLKLYEVDHRLPDWPRPDLGQFEYEAPYPKAKVEFIDWNFHLQIRDFYSDFQHSLYFFLLARTF